MLKSYILPVHRVVQETADAISLHFKQPAVDRIWYKAGQYLSFRFHLKGESHVRSYSISSAPRLDDTLAVTIKKVEGGLISNYLLADAHPGMQLEMSRPLGRFFVENSVKEERQLVLLGAGSGITPLFSILRSTLINEPKSTVALIYANRSPKETIFRDQLQSLQQTFASRFQLINHYSQEQGRMEVSQLKSYLEEIGMGSEAEYMLCGPEGWMKMIRQGLYEAGIPEHQLRQESFAIPEQEQKAQLPSDGPTREVEVQLGEQRHHFKVPAGTTILDAALSQGLNLPHSCKAGTCAACMGRIQSGQVTMDSNDALLDFEIEQGKVLVCQAHPDTDDVKIRIGWN